MTAYLPKIFAVYNKREATQVTHEARKNCLHQAFRASFTLAASLYIGAGDGKTVGDFSLRQRRTVAQAVAELHHLAFTGRERARQKTMQVLRADFCFQIVADVVLGGQNVGKCKGIAVLVGFNGFVHRNVLCTLFSGAEKHQDFIFNASCRIGGKLDALVGIKRIDGFDETDGADRNQIVLIAVVGIIFL